MLPGKIQVWSAIPKDRYSAGQCSTGTLTLTLLE